MKKQPHQCGVKPGDFEIVRDNGKVYRVCKTCGKRVWLAPAGDPQHNYAKGLDSARYRREKEKMQRKHG